MCVGNVFRAINDLRPGSIVVLRQEALQTWIVQVDDAEVSAEVRARDRAGERGKALARVMQGLITT
jgi:hypothetical protein